MPFNQQASILGNQQLRVPQQEGWTHIHDHFARDGAAREVGLILPVGCGKSGLIAISPFRWPSDFRRLGRLIGQDILGLIVGGMRKHSQALPCVWKTTMAMSSCWNPGCEKRNRQSDARRLTLHLQGIEYLLREAEKVGKSGTSE